MISFPGLFLNIFNHTVGLEGGYSDDKHDSGGKTNHGVAWEYDKDYLIEEGIFHEDDMKNLSLDTARAVHYKKYWIGWKFYLLEDLPLTVKVVYDFGFHEGKYGWMAFQKAYGLITGKHISIDGACGPQTMGAINDLCTLVKGYPKICLNDENFAKLVDCIRGMYMIEILFEQDKLKMPIEKAMTYLNSGIRRTGLVNG